MKRDTIISIAFAAFFCNFLFPPAISHTDGHPERMGRPEFASTPFPPNLLPEVSSVDADEAGDCLPVPIPELSRLAPFPENSRKGATAPVLITRQFSLFQLSRPPPSS